MKQNTSIGLLKSLGFATNETPKLVLAAVLCTMCKFSFCVFLGTFHDVVHWLPRSDLLVVSHVSRRERAESEEVRHLRGCTVVGRGAYNIQRTIGVNAAGVAGVATPQYLTHRGRPVLTTPQYFDKF